jgi:hypothetical protein
MRCDITTAEAMMFAAAIHEALEASDTEMPHMVILTTATRVNFKSDDLYDDVLRIVKELTSDER